MRIGDSMEDLLDCATCETSTTSNYDEIIIFARYLKPRREQYSAALCMVFFKIRTWNNRVGLLSLNVIEECINQIGRTFLNVLFTNIYLNEIIKIIHPTYDGNSCTGDVRIKIIQLLHVWARKYPEYPKIEKVYNQLVITGVVKESDLIVSTASHF
uniref:ADP-ribosylation factor-binding protein GGA3 (Trinotate prediction) n=1 Tax=Henneguya salminicola TaxID=69463 RepID=A0A6G3MF33_HENSL